MLAAPAGVNVFLLAPLVISPPVLRPLSVSLHPDVRCFLSNLLIRLLVLPTRTIQGNAWFGNGPLLPGHMV